MVTFMRDPEQSLAQLAYKSLKERIFKLSFLPGDRLSESELAEALGLSRTPLRQALQRLQHEGLVDSQPKVGWIISPLDFKRLDSLYDFRILIECYAARRICQADQASTGLMSLLSFWNVARKDRVRCPEQVSAKDEAFHQELVRLSGNSEVAKTHAEITEKIRLVRRLDFSKDFRIDLTYEEHRAILKALIARRADEAQRLLSAHIEQSKIEVRKITLDALYQVRDLTPSFQDSSIT